MKKTIKSLLAIAVAAFAFTACSDVPEPYPMPGTIPTEEIGDGTEAEPLTVANAIKKASSTGAFVKGYIVGYIWGTKSDNAIFAAPDTATVASNILLAESADETRVSKCMPIQLPSGAVRSALNLKDNKSVYKKEVTLYGTIEKYFGNTGMKSVSYAVLDGKSYGTKPGGSDTPEEAPKGTPISIKDFLAAAESTDVWYELTGTVKNMKDDDIYGNFDLEDETGSVYVYGLLAQYKGEAKKFKELAAEKGIKNGSKLTIIGNRGSYKDKIEVLNAFFVKVEGGGGDTPTPTGDTDGTEAKPYTVTDAIAAGSGTSVFIKAYIVGWIDGKTLSDGAKFNADATVATNIIIAGTPDVTDISKCMPVQLPSGAVRSAVNLQDNAGNYKKEILMVGNIEKYFGATGVKSVSYAKIGDTEAGTKPGGSGGETPSGDEVRTVTIADFNAAAESDTQWFKLTGTVKNLKDGDKYGNFDLEDATGSVYVYGLLSEKGGAKQKFQELVAAKGIANGSKITIIGLRSSYNGQIQVKNAYFVSIEGGEQGGGGQATGGTGADGSTIISVADFNAAAESTNVWYQLTGTIKNLKDGDKYGNFDLEDSTGSVYVYGVLSEKGGAKQKFQELVAAKGIANGKTITIVGNRGSYQGKIEVMNAYFIKVE